MSATAYLGLINVFVGDIQGGLGPFLATWLAAAAQWKPGEVGLVVTIVGLATLALNGPAGALADRTRHPRLLVALACVAILAGTLLLLPARAFWAVLLAQFVAAAGGTLVIPALNNLTLGIVGKKGFPRQQGRNQAFNHVGILIAAVIIGWGTARVGLGLAFWVLGAMAVAAIAALWATPAGAWNRRRAHGWQEDKEEEQAPPHALKVVFTNRRLFLISVALAFFNLGNGTMLGLIGQRMVSEGLDATGWTATYVVVAQLTMIPVALWAGSLADRRGRRQLLLLACAVLPVRALICAFVSDPYWLVAVEVLDGIASGVIGVAVPVLVADLTWGTGRTQTALGVVNAVQGLGGALSGVFGGYLATSLGWTVTFLALAASAGVALVLALWVQETDADVSERQQQSREKRRERRLEKRQARAQARAR